MHSLTYLSLLSLLPLAVLSNPLPQPDAPAAANIDSLSQSRNFAREVNKAKREDCMPLPAGVELNDSTRGWLWADHIKYCGMLFLLSPLQLPSPLSFHVSPVCS